MDEPKYGVYAIDRNSGRSWAERILEFCETPKSRKEIGKYFHFSKFYLRTYVAGLLTDGKLKCAAPHNMMNSFQKFVNTEMNIPVTYSGMILDFCKEIPRSRKEISERIGISYKNLYQRLRPLLKSGQLLMTLPESPRSVQQCYVTAE